MAKPDVSGLTEKEMLHMLAARRRAQRLQSLQRVAKSAREGATAPDWTPAAPAGLALPAPAGSPIPIPLPSLYPGESTGAALPDRRSEGCEADSALLRRRSPGMPALRLSPLSSPGAEKARGLGDAIGRLPWDTWRDRGLLFVELCAMVALLVIVAGQFTNIGSIDPELAEARRAPIATAVPIEEELPGSSTPPSSNEMPAPLRPLVRSGTPIPIPTPGPQAATRLVITAIDVDSVIVEGDSWELLKQGVGHHVGTPNPGERGNAVYSGHNDVYGEVFRRLEELKSGDIIKLYAGPRVFHYEVKRTRIVGPKEISVMSATPDATLTLITCYPYRIDTQRLVVIAKLAD